MPSGSETITGKVNVALLEKADRLFRNDDAGVWIELLQNSRRAGATVIDITIEETSTGSSCLVTMHDDGHGIDDFQSLLTLGSSNWDVKTQAAEDPAGMGFFSLCRSEVEVHSDTRRAKIAPSVFLGKGTAVVERAAFVRGTRIRFERASTRGALVEALHRVTEFCPLEIRLDRQALARHDFLEGALYREVIDGIEVGFATAFQYHWTPYGDLNWNFYGARIHEALSPITGLMSPTERTLPATLYARFNVLETAQVKLQLPDRRAIIQDDFLTAFLARARAAAYRFFRAQERHVLPFKNWAEARDLGVELPEAAHFLSSWHASPRDENVEPLFGYPKAAILADVSDVLLVERGLEDEHTLEGALECGAVLEGKLHQEKAEFEGYQWYDALPRLVQTEILVDGVGYDAWSKSPGRPANIEIVVTIEQAGKTQCNVQLRALIHAASSEINEISFVAVRNSPWDNDELNGPFSVVDFISSASFCSSDDCQSDSWDTQKTAYDRYVEREVNAYFRGPRATLLALLREGIDWDADQIATAMGITEIRFTRESLGRFGWQIGLVPKEHQSPSALLLSALQVIHDLLLTTELNMDQLESETLTVLTSAATFQNLAALSGFSLPAKPTPATESGESDVKVT